MTFPLDKELLIELMAFFETDEPPVAKNPFELEIIFSPQGMKIVDENIRPFLEGNAVPETLKHLHVDFSAPPGDVLVPFAIAGMLQGLYIGFEYARRTGAA